MQNKTFGQPKSFINVVQQEFSSAPTNQALGFASWLKPSCRAGKYTYRTLMLINYSATVTIYWMLFFSVGIFLLHSVEPFCLTQ
jgi:hypothetical protein